MLFVMLISSELKQISLKVYDVLSSWQLTEIKHHTECMLKFYGRGTQKLANI